MPVCKKIRGRRRQICIGDLDRRITLEDRNILVPQFDSVDFDEGFTNQRAIWSEIKTPSGKVFFDGVSTETLVTHMVSAEFDGSVSATKTWIKLENGNRLRILEVENLDERSEFMRLSCTDRGNKEASKA